MLNVGKLDKSVLSQGLYLPCSTLLTFRNRRGTVKLPFERVKFLGPPGAAQEKSYPPK